MRRAKLIIYILSITLVGILLLSTVSSNGQEEQKKEVWTGKLEDETVINKYDLSKILDEHKKWIETEGKEGQQADLFGADLSSAYLSPIDLSGAKLIKANLSDADLIGTNLSKANLSSADLSGAKLSGANLSEADLREANLSEADLFWANLTEANLTEANLTQANLTQANLSEANLSEANLSEANLSKANLSKAELVDTNLKDAIFSGVNLEEAQYEPISSTHKGYLGGIKGLTKVWFKKEKQSGLVQLRTALKDAGLRNLEREATYTIEHWKTNYAPWYARWIKRFFFEWTCGYGLNYLRPLLILSGLIVVFSIPYIVSLSRQGEEGIWMEWASKRMQEKMGKNEPFRLKPRGGKIFSYGFYFSLLSAFHIGWRDLNVGSWISRIQPREYTLKATGWVRVVSGAQSLISIYLLALWALTQFGRPFE